jgi:hypothetical protein
VIEYFDAEEEDIEHFKAAEAAALANSNNNSTSNSTSGASPSASTNTASVKVQSQTQTSSARAATQDLLKDYLANMPAPTTVQLERLAKAGMPLDWTTRTQQVRGHCSTPSFSCL